MASLLYRLGSTLFRVRRVVVLVWAAIIVLVGVGAATLSQGTENSFSIPGTESTAALEQLGRTFPQVSGTSATYLVVAPDGQSVDNTGIRDAVEGAIGRIEKLDGVVAVQDPYDNSIRGAIAADESALRLTVQLEGKSTELEPSLIDELRAEKPALLDQVPAGTSVTLGGEAFSMSVPAVSPTEGLGVLIALVVLLITFGSFLAAAMPLGTAILGVAVSMAGILLTTVFAPINSTTPILALMLGLAVGIDYSLFIISRHQDQLRQGMDPQESTARSLATAGSAVVFAGLTVMIALVGLSVANIPFLTTMGVAAAVAVGIAVVVALTLTPALLGFAGERLRPGYGKARRGAKRAARRRSVVAPAGSTPAHQPDLQQGPLAIRPPASNRFFRGWVRLVTRAPLVTVAAVVVGLLIVAIPALSLKLALPDAGGNPRGTDSRTTYDLIAEHFGPGYNGPLIVTGTIIGSTDPLGLMDELRSELEALPGVAAVPLATPNMTADTGIIQVIPETGPDTDETKALVQEIRDKHDYFQTKYGVDLSVTGHTAVAIDVSDRLGAALVPFALLVVGLSFILLTMVFRSLWVPIKATVGFLLSVVAAFGVVGAVFEWGWGAELLHVDRTGPIISFMPIIVMGVLFGLAMDYEVFLVSRMREDYVHHGNARAAIHTGFVASAKVVTAAAIIMFSVFAAFVPEGSAEIKTIGLALAVGVFVDAFIVRMTLVPAVLHLLGERAWYLPRWLDRILPSFDVEGEALTKELQLAEWPEPGANYAIAAEGLTLGDHYADVDLRVRPGEVLVISTGHRRADAALLLTLAGRMHAESGILTVTGLAAPVRASDIRSRVAVALLDRSADARDEVRTALAGTAPVVALNDLDAFTEPDSRRAVQRELAAARERARAAGRTLTLIVTTGQAERAYDIIPADATVILVSCAAASSRRELTEVH